MARPLILGMSPSPNYPDEAWDERADSTRFLATVILGNESRAPELKKLFDMDNLNKEAPPPGTRFAPFNTVEAEAKLAALEEDYALLDRLVIVLGDKVAKAFGRFAACELLNQKYEPQRVSDPNRYLECDVLFVPHPSYFLSKGGYRDSETQEKLSAARNAMSAPLDRARLEAEDYMRLLEEERLADAREERERADFDILLSNEEVDRQELEEAAEAVREAVRHSLRDQDELSDEYARFERLTEHGWPDE